MKIALLLKKDKTVLFKNLDYVLKQGFNYYTDSDKNLIDYVLANDKSVKVYVTLNVPIETETHVFENVDYYSIPTSCFLKYFKRIKTLNLPHKQVPDQVVEDHTQAYGYTSLSDVIEKAIKYKWLIETPVTGQYIYTEKWLNLISYLKSVYKSTVLDNNYSEIKLPHLVPVTQLVDTGHICTITPELYFLSKFKKRDTSFMPKYAKMYLQNKVDKGGIQYDTQLQPAYFTHNCCSGLWPSVKNTHTPLRLVDLEAWSLRNQGGAANNQERLESFSRIELISVDSPQMLKKEFEVLFSRLRAFYIKLKVPFKIVKTSAWYKESTQSGYDFNVHLDKVVEVGNLTYLGTAFTEPYNVKVNNSRAHSLCSGTGLQRLCLAFLAVNSFDCNKWYIDDEIK